jgi:hypothetical protein
MLKEKLCQLASAHVKYVSEKLRKSWSLYVNIYISQGEMTWVKVLKRF